MWVPCCLPCSTEDAIVWEPLSHAVSADASELEGDFSVPVWDHLEELRERVLVAGLATLAAICACFCVSKDLVVFLEAPVAEQGVRFLQLSPGEFFFTTLKVSHADTHVLHCLSSSSRHHPTHIQDSIVKYCPCWAAFAGLCSSKSDVKSAAVQRFPSHLSAAVAGHTAASVVVSNCLTRLCSHEPL